VDVRLLVPGSSDVPILQPIVRAGYRPIVEAGIRVFEWNGSMLHAKTAVADGRWSRVGSTNLNLASWATNWELDVVVEDAGFAEAMEAMYLEDLANATEIVPGFGTRRQVVRNLRQARRRSGRSRTRMVGRFAAGAIALSNSASAAIGGSRSLTATEARSVASIGVLLIAAALLVSILPVLVVAPLVIMLVWFGIALLARAFRLSRRVRARRQRLAEQEDQIQAGE
jgi:cardiolipin synthase